MIELSRYVFETLREDAEFAFCRGRRDDGELPTILLIAREFSTYRKAYDLNPLRYDLLKLKGHGLLERDSSRYAYRLTQQRYPGRSALLPQVPMRSAR
jgi:hypothetical protein